MQRLKLFFSMFFRLLIIFLFFFIWIRYFIKEKWARFLISISLTLLTDILVSTLLNKKKKNNLLKMQEQEKCENMFLSLALDKTYLDFFLKLAKRKHDAIKKTKYIMVKNNNRNTILFPHLSFSNLSPNDIIEITKKIKEKYSKLIIICYNFDKDCQSFINKINANILILDRFQTYTNLYKEYNFFPKIQEKKIIKTKTSFKELLSIIFNKSRIKNYFLSSIFLFFSSLFVSYNLYYCIFSSLLLIFCFISLIDPFKNKKLDKEII